MPEARTAEAAFFDVDETLVGFASMYRFLAYHLAARGEPPETYERVAAGLRTATATLPRVEANRYYHRLFADEDAGRLAATGRAWWASERTSPRVYVAAVRAELAAHRAAGRRIVLVSGQGPACLDPIAAEVGAHAVHGPLIGAAKAAAVDAEARAHGLDLAASYAYGDHASDLPMLARVGHPVVVGTRDPVLAGHAAAHGWRVLA